MAVTRAAVRRYLGSAARPGEAEPDLLVGVQGKIACIRVIRERAPASWCRAEPVSQRVAGRGDVPCLRQAALSCGMVGFRERCMEPISIAVTTWHPFPCPLFDQTGVHKEMSALIYERRISESHLQSLLIAPLRTGSSVRWKAISLFP